MSPLTPLFISLGIGVVIMISVGVMVYIKKKRNPKGAIFSENLRRYKLVIYPLLHVLLLWGVYKWMPTDSSRFASRARCELCYRCLEHISTHCTVRPQSLSCCGDANKNCYIKFWEILCCYKRHALCYTGPRIVRHVNKYLLRDMAFEYVVAVIFVGVFWLIIYLCRRRCIKHREDLPAPVVVTTTTQHAPTGRYPVTVEPTPSGGYQATPYPTTMPVTGVGAQPYPLNTGAMPMPATHQAPYPNVGFQTNVVQGYPPAAGPASNNMNPPSYDQVVSSDSYVKQAPYNPNYTGAPTH